MQNITLQHNKITMSVNMSIESLVAIPPDKNTNSFVYLKFLIFHNYLMEGFRIDLKTFLGLAMPNQYS